MRYLIIPSRPTPNGRLHLGHIAGPYLRADVLKRSLLRSGHDVYMISGVDAYESFMDMAVAKDNHPYSEIVEATYQEIYSDLRTFQIGMDSFINVASELKSFEINANKLMGLVPQQFFSQQEESIPIDLETNESITGAWISGICPHCSMEVTGFICETCSALLRIEDHQCPYRRNGVPFVFQKRERIYLTNAQPTKILRALERKKVASRYIDQIKRLFSAGHTSFPLTYPVGKRVVGPRWATDSSQMIYSAATNLAYAWIFGEVWRTLTGKPENPLSVHSNVRIITTFGRDALVPYLHGSVLFENVITGRRGFDRFILNDFLYLDGRKFSTSRGHAIWVQDAKNSEIPIDAWRWFLCSIDMENSICNFKTSEFSQFLKYEYNTFLNKVIACAKIARAPQSLPTPYLDYVFFQLMAEQKTWLDIDQFQPARAVRTLSSWMEKSPITGSDEAFYWLFGAAILSFPFMPDLAKCLWFACGQEKERIYASTLQEGRNAIPKQLNLAHLKNECHMLVEKFTNQHLIPMEEGREEIS